MDQQQKPLAAQRGRKMSSKGSNATDASIQRVLWAVLSLWTLAIFVGLLLHQGDCFCKTVNVPVSCMLIEIADSIAS